MKSRFSPVIAGEYFSFIFQFINSHHITILTEIRLLFQFKTHLVNKWCWFMNFSTPPPLHLPIILAVHQYMLFWFENLLKFGHHRALLWLRWLVEWGRHYENTLKPWKQRIHFIKTKYRRISFSFWMPHTGLKLL